MRDRQPTQPGRVKITPENGGEAFYAVMEMADEPTDLGTPPTKANLLTDETAGFYGKDANATVNNVLAELGVYMQYWWRARSVEGHYEAVFGATETANLTGVHGSASYTLSYSSSYEINQTTGEVALVNPTVIKKTYTEDVSATLRGKYFSTTNQPGKIFSAGSNAVFDSSYTWDDGVPFYFATLTNCSQITSKYVESIGDSYYLRSNDRNAYPDSGIVGGIEYHFLGKPFDNAIGAPGIEAGSYTGTGYNVSSTASSVTLNFQHQPIAVFISTTNSDPQSQVLVRGSAYVGGDVAQNGNTTTSLTWGGKSLTISNTYYGAVDCFNESGKTYYYYAMYIGG